MHNRSLNILIMGLFFLDANATLDTQSYNFGEETIFICNGIPEYREANVDIKSVANFFAQANEKQECLKVAYNMCFRLACKGDVDAMYIIANACLSEEELSFISSDININGQPMTKDQFWTISDYLEQHLDNDDEINYKTLFQEAVREAIKNSSEPMPVKRSISDTESEASPKVKERKINAESPDLTTATVQGSL